MRLYVPLSRQEYEALERYAYAERRRPQDQAAVLLAKVLAGELTAPQPDHDTPNEYAPRREPKEAAHVSA